MISYPYTLNAFADLLDIAEVEWDIQRNDELSGSGDARIWQAELADPLWTGDVRLTPSHHNKAKQVAALVRKLHGAQHSFMLYDPLSKYPQSVKAADYRNALRNPSFEDGLDPHTVTAAGGAWATATEIVNSGFRALRYSRSGQTGTASAFLNGATANSNPLRLIVGPGERVYASVRSRRFGGASATGFMNLVFRDASGAALETHSVSLSMTTAFLPTIQRRTAPAGTAYVTMALVVSNAGDATLIYFDDAELRKDLAPQINSISSNRNAMQIKSLPSFFRITRGDKFQIEWGSPSQNYLGEFSENMTANTNGDTQTVEVFPHIPLGIVADANITLIKPAAKVFIMPQSHSPGRARKNRTEGQGFRVMERRR